MNIPPIQPNQPTFGYKHPLKEAFKKGKLPFIKVGMSGEPINAKNVTIEHIQLHSKGGKTEWNNVALTSADKNQERGRNTLTGFINWKGFGEYCEQFIGQHIPGFGKGEDYVKGIVNTVAELLKKGE